MTNVDHEFVRQYELETWARCSENYLDTFSMFTNSTVPALVDATGISAGSKVLDVGCGPGNTSAAIASFGADVTGIDFSAQMLHVARTNYPDISFLQADVENIPVENDTFDAVTANYVVHHLADPVRVFSEITRVLKPNGRFAFIVWGPPEEQSAIGAFFAAVEAHHDLEELPHGPLFGVTDYETFQSMIDKGGLNDFKLSKRVTEWKCATLEPVVNGMATWANLAAFPDDMRNRILKSMEVNCQPYADARGFNFPHSAMLGCASK
jgi:ubiquinone/menaquinone biosynthesis C-methylase UbiE